MPRPKTPTKTNSVSAELATDEFAGTPLDRASRALIALLVADREERLNPEPTPRPTAVLLLESGGLSVNEVAVLTGRT